MQKTKTMRFFFVFLFLSLPSIQAGDLSLSAYFTVK